MRSEHLHGAAASDCHGPGAVPGARRYRAVRRWATVALLGACGLVAAPACDDSVGMGPGAEDVLGVWQAEAQDGPLYLHVEEDALTFYAGHDGCHVAFRFLIVGRSGVSYTLREPGAERTQQVRLRRLDERLRIRSDTGELFMDPSDVDPDELELCVASSPE